MFNNEGAGSSYCALVPFIFFKVFLINEVEVSFSIWNDVGDIAVKPSLASTLHAL
jgi:hypothetical protein